MVFGGLGFSAGGLGFLAFRRRGSFCVCRVLDIQDFCFEISLAGGLFL